MRFCRNFQLRRTVQGGNFDFAAQRGGDEVDGHFAMQVVAVALKDGVGGDVDFDVQIARRAAIDARLAMPGVAQAHAFGNAGRNLDFQRLVVFYAPGAATGGTRAGDVFAAAVAVRAGLLQREETLLDANLAAAVAVRAGLCLRAGTRAAAVAGFAFRDGGDADGFFGTARGFFQRNFEVVAQVRAAIDVAAPATGCTTRTAPAAEEVAKNVGKGVGKAFKPARTRAAHGRVDTGVTIAVVGGFFVGVGEHFVGFAEFLELFFRFAVAGVAVGVILHGELAVRLFDDIGISVAVDAEHFVVIAFGHGGFR